MSLGLANFTYDSITGIFAFDATIQNDLGQVMGSSDGTTITGIKIFFFSGPTCTGGSCYVSNADGTGTFTASNQPYFEYNQMLAPQQVSASKNWQIYVDPAVESFNFEIEAYAAFPAEYSVNQTPPDTLPVAYYGDTNITSNATQIAGELLKNVVVVDFQTTAQLADRQLAIAKIGGTLIGGDQIDADSDGVYYVAVPSDSIASGVFAAQDTLMGLTAVADVNPEIILPNSAAYLRPHDDSASGWSSWQVNPDSARSANWGPEAVAAPLAWGCSTGDTTVLVGIADHNWHDVADTRSNVTFSEALNAYSDTIHDLYHSHGQYVNSLIAASGNNGSGIAGMVWTARVARTETALRNTAGAPRFDSTGAPVFSVSSEVNAVERAIRRGARIINFSYGISWPPGHVLTAAETRQANSIGAFFTARLRRLAAPPLNLAPLIVVSAGNARIDASTSGYPQAANDATLRPRIIVVGASYRSATHAEAGTGVSDNGSLLDVAAPGVNVSSLNEFGRIDTTLVGTSFAAPVVAGIAAELAAFDHTLSSSDLKTLIVNGATNGGRTWGTVPIVNAYESLKLAAQRRGARLCGNRLYTDSLSDTIYAERAGGVPEALGALSQGAAGAIAAVHGGSAVYALTGFLAATGGSLSFNGTGWQANPGDTTFSTLSGAQISSFNLSNQMDHDGDTTITVSPGVNCGGPTVTFGIGPTGGTSQPVATFSNGWSCNSSGFGIILTAAAYNPVSRRMLISITTAGNASVAPPTMRTDVYSVPIDSGLQTPSSPIASLANTTIGGSAVGAGLGFSEDGSEVWSVTARYSNPINTTWGTNIFSIDFWDPATFALRATRSANQHNFQGGGIAPNRVARSPNSAQRNAHHSSSHGIPQIRKP